MADTNGLYLVGAVLVLTGAPAHSAEEGAWLMAGLMAPRSSITAEAGVDGEGSQETSLDLDLALARGERLRLFAGTSSYASDDTRIDVDTLRLGLASDPLNPVAFDVEYEWWGNRDDIEIGAWRLGVTWSGARWSARALWESREIRLFTQGVFAPIRPFVDFDSDGWELALTYSTLEAWDFTVSRREIDYSAQVGKLSTARLAPYVFTATAFGLGSGLLESHTGLEAVRYFAQGSVAFTWERTDSAVDGSHSHSLAVAWSQALDDAWTLTARVGQFDAAGGDGTPFGSVALSYAW